jgi:hypothetical protein
VSNERSALMISQNDGDRDYQGNDQCSNTANGQCQEWIFYHRSQCGEAEVVPRKSSPASASR